MARTPNYNLELIDFNKIPWHSREHDNWRSIDAIFANFITVNQMQGVWQNATAVTVGQRFVDAEAGTIFTVLVAHTTASTGLFSADRTANTTYWEIFSDVALAESWASSLAGLVNSIDYSSKAYAVGTVSQLPNGSAKRWAVEVEDTVVITGSYSALHHATKAAASAVTAATQASNASTQASNASTSAATASTQASNASTSATTATTQATLAANYAVKVDGVAAGTDHSAKAWAVGGTGITDTSSKGAAREWAIEAEDNTVAGSGTFSALHYSAKAAAQASAAASSATTATNKATIATAAAQGWGAVTTVDSNTSIEHTDGRTYYIIDAEDNTVTITLPPIGSSDGTLFGFQVSNVDNAITIARDGDTINGAGANYTGLTAVGQVIHFIADDGSPDNWLATIISQSSTATATAEGVVELATDAESVAGTAANRAVTPASLHAKTASATVIGLVELATDAEALTGTDTARAVTPANAKATYSGIIRTINAQAGTTYTLALADAGKIVTSANSGTQVITIPPNGTIPFPTGTQIDIYNLGTGIASITGGTGVTLNGVSTGTGAMNAQYAAVTIFKVNTNIWLMTGAHGAVA